MSLQSLKQRIMGTPKPSASEIKEKKCTPQVSQLGNKSVDSSVMDPEEQDLMDVYDMGKPAEIEQFQYNSFDSADSDDFSDYSDLSDNEEIPTHLQTNVVKKPTEEIAWRCRKI